MKKALIVLLALLSLNVFSQTKTNEASRMIASRTSIVIDASNSNFEQIKSTLLASYPSKQKEYTWTLKNVMIPGIDRPLTLDMQQGISGVIKNCSSDEAFVCGSRGSYFLTFANEKEKQLKLNDLKSNENQTILIRAKHGKKYAFKNLEEVQLVKQYLKTL